MLVSFLLKDIFRFTLLSLFSLKIEILDTLFRIDFLKFSASFGCEQVFCCSLSFLIILFICGVEVTNKSLHSNMNRTQWSYDATDTSISFNSIVYYVESFFYVVRDLRIIQGSIIRSYLPEHS